MIGTELVVGFDYSQVTANVAAEMREAADRVRGLIRASVIEVGRELLAVKQQLEHGQFVPWVERECRLSLRAAQRAMRAAEMVGKNDKLAYLPADGLLALASRSPSEPIVAQIIEQIETGAQPTAAEIKRQIAAARDEANALRAGAQARDEMRSPSPDAELGALIDAWERVGGKAREAFLDQIGAVLTTAAQIEKAKLMPSTVSSEPPAEVPARPDHGSFRTMAPIAEEEPPTAPSAPSASPDAPAVISREIGIEGVTSPQIDLPEHQPGSPDPITAVSAPRDTGGCLETEAHQTWAGLKPPSAVTCYTRSGVCRYDGCAQFGRCRDLGAHASAEASPSSLVCLARTEARPIIGFEASRTG